MCLDYVFRPVLIFNELKSTKTRKSCGVDGLVVETLFMLVQLYMYICLCYLIVLLHTVIYIKTL